MDAPKVSLTRVLVKAALLFLVINVVFAVFNPMPAFGKLTLYNWLLPGRERLPYGDDPARSYNLNLYNLEAMFASHKLAGTPKAGDEFRILVIGDSSVWGFLLRDQDTLASALNAANLHAADERRAVFYNLGHPTISLTKDLMILDEAMQYDPDLVLWPVTLEAFPWSKQSSSPLVKNNAARVSSLVVQNALPIAVAGADFVHPTWLDRTLVGQRRNLADLIRLQLYGFAWAATCIDIFIPDSYELRATDLEASDDYAGLGPALDENELAFDVLAAGVRRAGSVPVLIVNEPIFVSDGANSDIRYNSFYPRWAYDQYRQLLADEATANGWHYADAWQAADNAEFTNTPIHLTPRGTLQFTDALIEILNSQFALQR
jgi:hypothetical protein